MYLPKNDITLIVVFVHIYHTPLLYKTIPFHVYFSHCGEINNVLQYTHTHTYIYIMLYALHHYVGRPLFQTFTILYIRIQITRVPESLYNIFNVSIHRTYMYMSVIKDRTTNEQYSSYTYKLQYYCGQSISENVNLLVCELYIQYQYQLQLLQHFIVIQHLFNITTVVSEIR